MIQEVRSRVIDAPPKRVFSEVSSLGGDRGWPAWSWAWKLRGLMDQMVGGPGLKRGRRHPTALVPGDVVDFWRVEQVESPSLLRLHAEMKVPGKGWLQWAIQEEGGKTMLTQTALFEPHGFWGRAYWYGLYPIHHFIFDALIDAVANSAAEHGRGS